MPKKDDANDSSVRSIEKAIKILNELSLVSGSLDLMSLSEKTKMPKSTLVRLLNTMKKHNFIYQDPKSKYYGLGWALIFLGQAAKHNFDLLKFIHPYLEKLQEMTGETIGLAIREESHVYYVDQILSNNLIKATPSVGSPLDLYCTASGKVFLSLMKESALKGYLNKVKFVRKTEHTITDIAGVEKELTQIRNQGFAVDNEEVEIGGRCIAAPIFDHEKKIAATISIHGPSNRMSDDIMKEFSTLVMEVAAEASKELGFVEVSK